MKIKTGALDLPSMKQMVYLAAVADEAHFKKAAERCGIGQPALSAQIQALEEKLGARLFERDRSGVFLTPAGREAVQRARSIIIAAQELVDSVESLTGRMNGTIFLGVKPTVGPYLMPQIVGRLHKQYPDLKLAIQEGTVPELNDLLASGKVDLIITELPLQLSDFVVTPLYREPLELALARDHSFSKLDIVKPAQLKNETILTIDPKFRLHDQVQRFCEQYGATMQSDYVGTSLDVLRQMVGMGMGITFLPALYIHSEVSKSSEVIIRKLASKTLYRQIGLAWRKGAGQVKLYQSIADTMRDVVQKLPVEKM